MYAVARSASCNKMRGCRERNQPKSFLEQGRSFESNAKASCVRHAGARSAGAQASTRCKPVNTEGELNVKTVASSVPEMRKVTRANTTLCFPIYGREFVKSNDKTPLSGLSAVSKLFLCVQTVQTSSASHYAEHEPRDGSKPPSCQAKGDGMPCLLLLHAPQVMVRQCMLPGACQAC
jgi:hypothetical protein